MPTCYEANLSLTKTTLGGIPYSLRGNFPTFSKSRTSASAQEEYIILWEDIEAFVIESLPPAVQIGCNYYYPLWRSMPGYPELVTESLEIKPLEQEFRGGETVGQGGAKYASVTINYGLVSNEEVTNGAGTILTFEHKISMGGEFLQIASNRMKWDFDGFGNQGQLIATPDVSPGKFLPIIEHQLVWRNLPSVPAAAIAARLGHVNGTLFGGAPLETLLFIGCEIERLPMIAGFGITANQFTLSYRFSEKFTYWKGNRLTWNHFPDAETAEWRRVIMGLVPPYSYVYDLTDFEPLFSLC